MANTITGYGAPRQTLAAEIGDIYKDLNTGKQYELVFISQTSDKPYKWKLVRTSNGKHVGEDVGGAGASSGGAIDDSLLIDMTTSGDTLTWDGNTEGLIGVPIDNNFSIFYHVSDIVPTIDDCSAGVKVTLSNGYSLYTPYELLKEDYYSTGRLILGPNAFVTLEENYEAFDQVFPKPGIWIAVDSHALGGAYAAAITIIGYMGFNAANTKKLDPNYIPSWNSVPDRPFGDFAVLTNYMEWDGNTEGLPSVGIGPGGSEPYMYRISTATPTIDDCVDGLYIYDNAYNEIYSNYDILLEGYNTNDVLNLAEGQDIPLLVIPTDDFSAMGVTFPEAGIWTQVTDGKFYNVVLMEGHVIFPATVTKKINPKYLPDSVNTYVFVKSNEDGVLEASRSFEDIRKDIVINGKNVIVVYEDALFHVTYVYGMTEMLTGEFVSSLYPIHKLVFFNPNVLDKRIEINFNDTVEIIADSK